MKSAIPFWKRVLPSRTPSGWLVAPEYWAFLFGGWYAQKDGYYGWRTSLYRHVWRYYEEGWCLHGHTLKDWVLGRVNTSNSKFPVP